MRDLRFKLPVTRKGVLEYRVEGLSLLNICVLPLPENVWSRKDLITLSIIGIGNDFPLRKYFNALMYTQKLVMKAEIHGTDIICSRDEQKHKINFLSIRVQNVVYSAHADL